MFQNYTHEQPYEYVCSFFLFWSFEFRIFEFVSDFEFRHSDLSCKYFQILLRGGYLRLIALREEAQMQPFQVSSSDL
jgi:hypothetical protein